MTWIEGNVGQNGNETTKLVNVEDSLALIPSMNGRKCEIKLEIKGGLTQPFLIFRGSTDAFTVYMKQLKKTLPATWVESLEGFLVNTSAAVGIGSRLVGGQYEVIVDFELDNSRFLSRNLFRTDDELLFNAFLDDLKTTALPSFWVESIEGYLVNTSAAGSIETRIQDAEKKVIAEFATQEYIIFQTETETELKAFMKDLTTALMSGQESVD